MERLPIIGTYHQRRNSACGPASLVICYRSLGLHLKEKTVCDDIVINNGAGAEWDDLVLHAIQNGFNVSYKSEATIYDLMGEYFAGHPTIISYDLQMEGLPLGYHYSVIKSIDVNQVVLSDPADNKFTTWPTYTFNQYWKDDAVQRAYLALSFPNEKRI